MSECHEDQRRVSEPARPSPRARAWGVASRIARYALLAIVLYFVGKLLVSRLYAVRWDATSFTPGQVVLSAVTLLGMAFLTALVLYCLIGLFHSSPWQKSFWPRAGLLYGALRREYSTNRRICPRFAPRSRTKSCALADEALSPRTDRPLPFGVTMGAAWVPVLGKYVPGKFASIVAGVWLLRKHDVPGATAGSLVLVRQALSVSTGLIVAAPLGFFGPVRQVWPAVGYVGPVVMLFGLVCLHPRVLGAVSGLILRSLDRRAPRKGNS